VSSSTDSLLSRCHELLGEYGFERAYKRYAWDEEMLRLMKTYAAQHETLVEKRRDLADARNARDKSQAANLWDTA
jgi:hypothetical protein